MSFLTKQNFFAQKTISYIWSHPNCQSQKLTSIFRFLGWQFYKRLTQKKIIIPLTANIKLNCYPDSRSASHALYCGLYDYNEMNFLLRYIQSRDSFIDIGANIGIYTLLAASKIKHGYIYSFEALPKNYERLLENINLNDLTTVEAYKLAISNSQGLTWLNFSDGDCTPSITNQGNRKNVAVPTNNLDNLATNIPFEQIMLGKMDIEGAEILALQGAASLLSAKQPPVWILEILNQENTEIINFLTSYGYQLYRYEADANILKEVDLSQSDGNNFLAIAKTELPWIRKRLSNC